MLNINSCQIIDKRIIGVQCSTVQYNTVQYSTVQYSIVQYGAVPYSIEQYSTAQYGTVQYNNRRGGWCQRVAHSIFHFMCGVSVTGAASVVAECGTNIFKTLLGHFKKSVTGSKSMCITIMASHLFCDTSQLVQRFGTNPPSLLGQMPTF